MPDSAMIPAAAGLVLQVRRWKDYQVANTTAFLKIVLTIESDPDWRTLPLAGRGLWLSVLLAAARTKNQIPYDDGLTICQQLATAENDVELILALLFRRQWITVNRKNSREAKALTHLPGRKAEDPDGDSPLDRKERREEKSRGNEKDLTPTPSRRTWLTPYHDAWIARYPGSVPPVGQMVANLKRLIEMHGAEKVLDHWRIYLTQTEERFVSVPRFASTFGAYDPAMQKPAAKEKRRPHYLRDPEPRR